MFRQKTIINRQRRNISQIANVQRKVRQTDRPANTAENIDKVRPANTAKLSTNISTKFARRRCRQSSPCKCDAIDNARQSNSVMVNETLIAQSQNSKLFRRQTSPFLYPKTTNPLNTKRVNRKEEVYTPKVKLLSLLPHEINSFAGQC